MASPFQHACRYAAGAVGLLLAAARLRQRRCDDRVHFATTVHVNFTDTADGFDLQFDQPNADCLVKHSATIQASASMIERCVGHMTMHAGQLSDGGVSLTLLDRTDERVRLAGKAVNASVVAVGSAMMVIVDMEGWVEHAHTPLAYHHSGAMVSRLILTGDRDAQQWTLHYVGDYTAAPRQRTSQPVGLRLTSAA